MAKIEKPLTTRHLHRVFALLGILSLGVFGLVLWREGGGDWLRFQLAAREPHPGIKQLILTELRRVDRCITCHLGIDDPAFKNEKQPLRTHPGNLLTSHPIEKFGCTVCHGGQGLATSPVEAAHGKVKFWETPLATRVLRETNCGLCHLRRDLPDAPNVTQGRRLLEQNSCQACHNIPGLPSDAYFGPSWDGIGYKVKRRWLIEWLRDPHRYLKRHRMPQYKLSEEERVALVEFLLKLKAKPLIYQKVNFEEGDSEHGGILFRESRCITCHIVKGKGGTIAPELGRITEKVRKIWLYNFLINPHYYQPNIPMLRFNFSPQDALDLVAYISEEFTQLEEVPPEEPLGRVDRKLARKGEELYKKYGCFGCHQISGVKAPAKIGPDLKKIGSRHADELDFGKVKGVVKNLPNWIYLKIKDPRIYDPKAKMPYYSLSDVEAAQMTLALLSLKDVYLPAQYKVKEETSAFRPQGKVGTLFKKYRCLTCHQIYGRGGTISQSPLDKEGSISKGEWLFKYLKLPYGVKTAVIERMPIFRMTDDEARTLAQYLSLVMVDDQIPEGVEDSLTTAEAERGKKLFTRKGCISCHILGKGGGYVGPDLNNSWERLNAGWIVKWLQNPKIYRPDTPQPDYGFSEKDSRALAAYLLSTTRKIATPEATQKGSPEEGESIP